jgi:hypothetical protein
MPSAEFSRQVSLESCRAALRALPGRVVAASQALERLAGGRRAEEEERRERRGKALRSPGPLSRKLNFFQDDLSNNNAGGLRDGSVRN